MHGLIAISFPSLLQKEKCTVFDYFVKTYNYSIKYPDLPLVWVGNRTRYKARLRVFFYIYSFFYRNILLPIELLELKQQCSPKSKALSAKNTQQMIKVTAVRPDKRQENIRKNLQARSFKKDKYANAFNITVHDNLAQIDGRILEPPKLDYNRIEDPKMATPANGKWKMPTGSTFRQPMSLESWGVFVATKADWNLVQNLQKVNLQRLLLINMHHQIFFRPLSMNAEKWAWRRIHPLLEPCSQESWKMNSRHFSTTSSVNAMVPNLRSSWRLCTRMKGRIQSSSD